MEHRPRNEHQDEPDTAALLQRCAELEARLAAADTMLENSTPGIVLFDKELCVVRANSQAAVLSGLPATYYRPGTPHRDILYALATVDEQRPSGDADKFVQARLDLFAGTWSTEPGKPVRTVRVRPNGMKLEVLTTPTPDGGMVVTIVDVTSRIRAEETADERAVILNAVMNNARIGLTVFDSEHRLLAQNEMARQLSGRPANISVIGRKLSDIITAIDAATGQSKAPKFRERILQGLTADRSKPFQYTRPGFNGGWVDVHSDPTPDGGFTITHVDVTALRQAREGELRLAELHRTMLETMEQGITIYDHHHRLMACNQLAIDMSCCEPSDFRPGIHVHDMISTLLKNGALGEGEGATQIAYELSICDRSQPHSSRRTNKRGRAIQASSTPTRDGGFVITYTDVTDFVIARNTSEAAARELQALIDAIPGVLIRQRPSSNSTWQRSYVSDSVLDMTGFTPEEAIAPNWMAHNVHPDDLAELRAQTVRAVEGEQSVAEFRFTRKDGRLIWVRALMRGNENASGQTEAICVWSDITREHALDEQVAHAKRLAQMGEVATGMAHEMNQPLASISMAAENALRALSNLPTSTRQLGDKLRVIIDQAHRAAALIDHIRVFSRSGQEHATAVRLQNITTTAGQLLASSLEASGVNLQNHLTQGLPEVLGRAGPLEQMMVSLIRNACEAYDRRDEAVLPGERVIRVEGSSDSENVHLLVSDVAGGIPEAVLSHVFEPFFTTKPVGQGTGLGLSMAYGIITDLGGSISVSNRNGGAVFHISLPRYQVSG